MLQLLYIMLPNPQFVLVSLPSFWNPSKGFWGLNTQQSRFGGKHPNPAISLVVNYFPTASECERHCVALFVDPEAASCLHQMQNLGFDCFDCLNFQPAPNKWATGHEVMFYYYSKEMWSMLSKAWIMIFRPVIMTFCLLFMYMFIFI